MVNKAHKMFVETGAYISVINNFCELPVLYNFYIGEVDTCTH